MQVTKLPKPMAVCSVCQALSNRPEYLNHRCEKVINGRRCYGIYKSGVSMLWDECEACGAAGKVGSQVCTACAGFGWTMYG